MDKKNQIFFIHGGMTFKNHQDYIHFLKTRPVSIQDKVRWSDAFLTTHLGENFEIIRPRMPLQDNARYEEWKIHFENFFPQLRDNIILIWESLWGTFLAKYLSEHKFPKQIRSTYLICPPYDNTLPDEDLVGGFVLQSDISLLAKNSPNLYIMFSEDDEVVPVSHAEKFKNNVIHANVIIYESKNGHFKVPEFPEIVHMIKADVLQ